MQRSSETLCGYNSAKGAGDEDDLLALIEQRLYNSANCSYVFGNARNWLIEISPDSGKLDSHNLHAMGLREIAKILEKCGRRAGARDNNERRHGYRFDISR